MGDLNSIPDDIRIAVIDEFAEAALHCADTAICGSCFGAALAVVWPAVEAHWRTTIADEIGTVLAALGEATDGRSDRKASRCCDLHNRNCEPPSELCCGDCTEAHHGIHADPPNFDRTLTSHHDGSKCVLDG
jgi:hypothetical protein